LRRGRKGIAGIVAAVFLFVMLFTVGTAYFITVNNENQLYLKTQASRNAAVLASGLESLSVSIAFTGNQVEFQATNDGGISANITAVFVLDSASNVLKCDGRGLPGSSCGNTTPPLPMGVNVGTTTPAINTGYVYTSGSITILVLTHSGKTYSAQYPPAPGSSKALAQIAQGIGSLVIIANSFRFYFGTSYSQGDGFPVGGYFGYVVPGTTRVAFSIQLLNEDPLQRSVTLDQKSLVTLSSNGVPSTNIWYIIGGISDSSPYTSGVTASSYSKPIMVQYGSTVTLYFSASTPGGTDLQNTLSSNQPVGVFLLMFGQYSDTTAFSQTIPFVSTYVTSAQITTSGPFSGCKGVQLTWSLKNFATPPHAYWVNSGSGTSTQIDTSSSTSSITFTIPGSVTTGYYQIFLSDGTNQAYATYQVTC
jgi:hypothetical protein